jgi:hypothetical protein
VWLLAKKPEICPNDSPKRRGYPSISTGSINWSAAHSTARLSDRKGASKSSPTSEWRFEGVATLDSSHDDSERSDRSVFLQFCDSEVTAYLSRTRTRLDRRERSARCCSEFVHVFCGSWPHVLLENGRLVCQQERTRSLNGPPVELLRGLNRNRLLMKNLSKERRRALLAALSADETANRASARILRHSSIVAALPSMRKRSTGHAPLRHD